MNRLRMLDGISGFPRRAESKYDTFGTAHYLDFDLRRAGNGGRVENKE